MERRGNFQLLNCSDKRRNIKIKNGAGVISPKHSSSTESMEQFLHWEEGEFLPALAVAASLSCGKGSVGGGLRTKNSRGPWMRCNIAIEK